MKLETENISCITDRELRGHLEYLRDMENVFITIPDRDRLVLYSEREIRTEAFKKFGFYVKRVAIKKVYGTFTGVEIFLER
jgi:hypothetical protein